MLDKDFKKDLDLFCEKLDNEENFAYVRFSDGEADILKNIKLVISDDYVIEGDFTHNFGYPKEDHKHFDPEEHSFVRDKLVESFVFSKDNYYTGIACPCCIGGHQTHAWMKKQTKRTNEFLTWANLFVNGNYATFIDKVVPILSKRKVVLICSKNADIKKASNELGFDIVKDFRVGENCIVNDHFLIDEIKEWIDRENIQDHVFLFSASSLSEILIHELFKDYDKNTYLDIGTTLHPFFGLGYDRDYLKGHFFDNHISKDSEKICIWTNDIYLVNNEEKYWENIRDLRNHPEVKKGFINQDYISKERHYEFMKVNSDKFIIALVDNIFAGYVGVINGDIRVATHPDFQGSGVGKYMINSLERLAPEAYAKVKIDNEASVKLFEACGFKKKYYILEKE
ncbi:MAG: GNAT family N-acetyltransferase [Planctomycetota bacterium]|jgi:GNAT superfamily N-acetyltransferase